MLGTHVLAATKTTSGGFSESTLIFIVLIIAAVYFLMIRPQQRRRQQATQQQNNIAPGARVMTTAGMYATVIDTDGDDVILEVAPGVEVRYLKRAIMNVVTSADQPEEESYQADDTETDEPADDTDEDTDTDDDSVDDKFDVDDDESAYEQATGTKKD
jgi:preprotein translocase subunit YajC